MALALALTGCKKTVDVDGGKSGDKDPVEEMSPEKKLAYDNYCIYFISDSAITLRTYNASKNWDGTLYYSIDLESWDEWDGTEISSGTDNKLYLRGIGNTVISDSSYAIKSFILNSENNISCYGNIMTLLDYEKVKNNVEPEMEDYCFSYLFDSNNKLIKAPDLPAKTLAKYCYFSMFVNCTSLTTAPELPAITLVDDCYEYMFHNCTSLKTAPALPARNLAKYCYYYMFYGCESLTTVPDLLVDTLADFCYFNMFSGCTNIKVYKTKPNDKKEYYEWTAPENPDNYEDCYFNMFSETGGEFTNTPQPGTTYYILRPTEE